MLLCTDDSAVDSHSVEATVSPRVANLVFVVPAEECGAGSVLCCVCRVSFSPEPGSPSLLCVSASLEV